MDAANLRHFINMDMPSRYPHQGYPTNRESLLMMNASTRIKQEAGVMDVDEAWLIKHRHADPAVVQHHTHCATFDHALCLYR